jgi:hypothetical protein
VSATPLASTGLLSDFRRLRRYVFPLQRIQKRLSFLETDADIARRRGIAAATDHENSMGTGLRTSISKLHGH